MTSDPADDSFGLETDAGGSSSTDAGGSSSSSSPVARRTGEAARGAEGGEWPQVLVGLSVFKRCVARVEGRELRV